MFLHLADAFIQEQKQFVKETPILHPLKTPKTIKMGVPFMLICHRELPLLLVSNRKHLWLLVSNKHHPWSPVSYMQHLCLLLLPQGAHMPTGYPQEAAVAPHTQQEAPMNFFLTENTLACRFPTGTSHVFCVPQVSQPLYFIPNNGSPFQDGITYWQ